jgi:hypothetical protein
MVETFGNVTKINSMGQFNLPTTLPKARIHLLYAPPFIFHLSSKNVFEKKSKESYTFHLKEEINEHYKFHIKQRVLG